ncbi:glycosyltransferase family A protein [Paenibacillus sp. S150]|uniref:glycosyltransferase family 2 protein n=1 Tax=Paenibacillus sp. S150 TaxID=2749826 RepID=UPI001C577508|nr:glycosyltransferase family A protein [Paenibacillus sp. S150]MBW4085636.1 glycosyltransferase family 2 protein [Paenibacillus sp. S150]
MAHSEELHQAGYRLLNQLNDDILHLPAGMLSSEELIHRCRHSFSSEGDAVIQENLEALCEVLQAYLSGRASEDAVDYYLSQQFNIQAVNICELMNGLAELKSAGRAQERRTPSTTGPYALPKVSVIITTYNRKNFLQQAVQSILRQDYPHKEITVIDDCSSDGTAELMSRSFGDDPRVIFMQNETNQGPGNNRRKALAAHGDGEYILFLDDDDYLIDHSYFSQAVHFHQQHPEIAFVAANVFLEYSKTEQLKPSSLKLGEITPKADYFKNFEQKGYPKPASTLTAIFKREALMKMDILNMNMVNDASIYLRALLIGDAGFIDTLAGVYRIHGNNITFNLSQSFLIENLEEKRLIRNMAIERYGYSKTDMNEWFNHNVYDTISYYLMNSAKSHTDFKSMYSWASDHCPKAYSQLKRQFRTKLMKKQLLRVSFVRTLLNR